MVNRKVLVKQKKKRLKKKLEKRGKKKNKIKKITDEGTTKLVFLFVED